MFSFHNSTRSCALMPFAFAGLLAVSLVGIGIGCGGSQASTEPAKVAPVITQQPADQIVMVGGSATFGAAATGVPAPTYQWRKGGTPLQGQNSAQLTFSSVQSSDEGTYEVVVSNTAGSVNSNPAILTVNRLPTFTRQPSNQQVVAPAVATFTVVADGKPAPTLQWESSTSGTMWSAISGATGATYTTGATSASQNGHLYRCVATSGQDSSTSQPATLLVNAGISYTLSVNLGLGVAGNPSVGGPYSKGASVPYSFSAMNGYTDLQVKLDGSPVAASGAVVMNGNHGLVATATVNTHKVTFLAGAGGRIQGTAIQNIPNGQAAAAVTAVPDAGKTFVNWTGAGFTASTANPLTLGQVTQDLTITANFAASPSTYTVTFLAGSGGTLSGTAIQSVVAGADAKAVTAVPSAGMSFVNWTGAGFTTSASNPLILTKVNQNFTLTANFEAIPTDTGFKVGQTAAEVNFVDAAGKTFRLSDFKGKVILLVCSEVYCNPCQTESKILQSIQDQYGAQGLVILENLSDFGTHKVTTADMIKWAADGGLTTVPVTHDTNDLPTLATLTGYPTNILIGRDFKIKSRQVGYSEYTVRNMVAQGMK